LNSGGNFMKTEINWKKGMFFECITPSGYEIKLDYNAEGFAEGPPPMENFLASAGVCSGMDVVDILKKMRKEITEFRIILNSKRASDYPKIFTDINYEYIIKGKDLKETDVERAIRLSFDKYCSIIAMIKENVNVDYSFKLLK